MAFQEVFSTKNVQRFSFGHLVAPELKKQGWAIMPPRVTTPFQSPGRIGLRLKNMHFGSPSVPWGLSGKAKPSYEYYITR